MLDPHSELASRLKAHRVRVRDDGPQAVILQNVPANARYFNKNGTNLMVKQAREGLPFLIAVDEDLKYTGPDPALAKAFAGGTTQQGWRIVFLDARTDADLPRVVEDALRAVGFDGVEPQWMPQSGGDRGRDGGLLSKYGQDLSARAPGPAIGRADATDEVSSALLLCHPRMPVVLGENGVGKSHLLGAVACRCSATGERVIRVDLGQLFSGTALEAERENLLAAAIAEAALGPRIVLALERFDLVFSETRHGPAVLAHALESGGRLIATAVPGLLPKLEQSILARHLHVVCIFPLDARQATEIVRLRIPALAVHHGVGGGEWLAEPIVERAGTLAGHHPAKALALADAAFARARLAGAPAVTLTHVCAAARGFAEPEE